MDIKIIGKQVAYLRKAKGSTQEELAKYVGVSTQAVSKWENGGVPDTELLPRIADFFGTSIDRLFDRSASDHDDLRASLIDKLVGTAPEKRFTKAFSYCWEMERAMFGHVGCDGGIEEYERELGETEQLYSSIMTDHGFTRMGIANRLQYFLLVPEIRDKQCALFDGMEYRPFFRALSDKDVWAACIMLHKRESTAAFTHHLLVKHLGLDANRAKEVMTILKHYHLLHATQIDMDDEPQTVYTFQPTPSFTALLIFAREMIETPNHFSYYSAARNKPYLA